MNASILKAIPWKEIAKLASIILSEAIFLKKSSGGKNGKEDSKNELALNKLNERIVKLEENETKQAELVKNISEQLSNVTTAAEILSKRLIYLLIMSCAAILISIIMLVLKIL